MRLIDDITWYLAIAILTVFRVLDLPAADLVILVVIQEEVFAARQISHFCAVCLEVCTLEASFLNKINESDLLSLLVTNGQVVLVDDNLLRLFY